MPDNLDRIERLIESNAKAILALTNQGIELNAKIDRTNAIRSTPFFKILTDKNNLDR